ncbi:MAG: DUF4331 domain-containing protein [Alcanivoracaceae bacterium]|nr:DUF4331 domain-containing protein [Alcanivoracaceae bacterium]
MHTAIRKAVLSAAIAAACTGSIGHASSHREAPNITHMPKVDASDFYFFRSYEAGREAYVTLIANYLPLQDAYGGPNYFDLDPNALYEIHIDNNGDAVEDITFSFRFSDVFADLKIPVNGVDVAVPLKNIGGIGPNSGDTGAVNVRQQYSIAMVRGDRRQGVASSVSNSADGNLSFRKPLDNIGNKSISDYPAYAADHIYDVAIPGCDSGRVFVGQRREGFAVNLGEIFDLVNTNPLGGVADEDDDLADKNVTSIALEVPASCLTGSGETVIGAWTTASMRQARVLNPSPSTTGKGASIHGGAWTQVSRLGMPLVNEVVIGLGDKDRFNASEPRNDGQFATYVTNPTLPELLEILFGEAGAVAPNLFPRTDLVAGFLTGIDGLNQPSGVVASEMLRLNTAVAITPPGMQNNLGALGADNAGFPNGRRPGDDVVDIALRVVMGALIPAPAMGEDPAPNRDLPFTDGAYVDEFDFDNSFPYLTAPLAGSPNSTP